MCVRIVRNGTQSQPSQSTPSSPVSIVIGRRPKILSNLYSSSSTAPSELLREIRFYDRTQLRKNFSVKMERKSTHIILYLGLISFILVRPWRRVVISVQISNCAQRKNRIFYVNRLLLWRYKFGDELYYSHYRSTSEF